MKAVQPVERVADQEIGDLAAAEVIDRGVPIGMKTPARVGMLEQRTAVEHREPVRVRRKMRRHPIEDDAEPRPVRRVYEAPEAVRRPVPRRGREQADGLIAPGGVERVLVDRQQLYVGEAEIGDVRDQFRRQVVIGQELSTFASRP
jgi:hypothetical protein